MGLKASQYQTIMRGYEQKQLHSRDILKSRYEEVYMRLPEFKSMNDSISILSVQYGKRLLGGDEHAIDSLKEELTLLRNGKQDLLHPAGFRQIFLNPSTSAVTAAIPATSETRSAIVSKISHQSALRAV